MKVPLMMTIRGLEEHIHKESLEKLIRERVAKLEHYCKNIISCHVAVEQRHKHKHTGNPYRVCIDVKIPAHHEIVVNREPQQGNMPLPKLIREAFSAAEHHLKQVVQKQRHEVKTHQNEQKPREWISAEE